MLKRQNSPFSAGSVSRAVIRVANRSSGQSSGVSGGLRRIHNNLVPGVQKSHIIFVAERDRFLSVSQAGMAVSSPPLVSCRRVRDELQVPFLAGRVADELIPW